MSSFPSSTHTHSFRARPLWNGSALAPLWSEVRAVELYNHTGDDGSDPDAFEIVNLATTTAPQGLLDALQQRLLRAYGFASAP